jgi:hypothetical protein
MDQVCVLSQRHPPAWVRPSPRVRGGVRCTSEGGAWRSPSGQARRRAGPPTSGGRCSNEWRDAVHGIGCRHGLGTVCSALQERPARWPVGCSVQLCEGEPTSATSGVTASPAPGQASKGRYRLRRLFAPAEQAMRKAQGSLQWTRGARVVSTGTAKTPDAIARDRRRLHGQVTGAQGGSVCGMPVGGVLCLGLTAARLASGGEPGNRRAGREARRRALRQCRGDIRVHLH